MWRTAKADQAALIVDAEDYYRHALDAMVKARSQILLIGWDLDTRVSLSDEAREDGAPTVLGPLLSWLSHHRPDLQIYILVWDEGMLSVPFRGSTPLRMLRWKLDPRISLKWDSSHPLDGSHHQKILVVDDKVAFSGGIDITADRWDTRKHKDDEPGRKRPFTRRVYEPWHDAIMAVDGGAAEAIGDLARLRWKVATGKELPKAKGEGPIWPEGLEVDFTDVELGIARTRAKDGEISEVREIEALFADMVAAAERFVYIETQYFASRAVAEAIGKRLEEPDGPEFVVINPKSAYGWLDEAVMGPSRYLLMKALEKRDPHKRFRIYTPVTEKGADIYVHAKIMIVDDRLLRVGSANLNNRSMGLDSECDLVIDAQGEERVCRTIERLRHDLIAEHFGMEPEKVARCIEEAGSLIAAIEKLRGKGRTLVPFEPKEPAKLLQKVAKSEALDPEAARELFEKRARPGLLTRMGRRGLGRR